MMAVFRRLDPRLRSSVTFDNDTVFARHGLSLPRQHGRGRKVGHAALAICS